MKFPNRTPVEPTGSTIELVEGKSDVSTTDGAGIFQR